MSKEFPIFTKYHDQIFVKHYSESKCLMIDLLSDMQKVQLLNNGRFTSLHYDNLILGKCDKSNQEEFESKKTEVLNLILNK